MQATTFLLSQLEGTGALQLKFTQHHNPVHDFSDSGLWHSPVTCLADSHCDFELQCMKGVVIEAPGSGVVCNQTNAQARHHRVWIQSYIKSTNNNDTKQRSLWHKVVFTQFIQITNNIQHQLCAFQLWNTECLRLENKTSPLKRELAKPFDISCKGSLFHFELYS